MTPEQQVEALAELRESARVLANAIHAKSPNQPSLWERLVEAWCNISDSET
jgi:hypothetical protein